MRTLLRSTALAVTLGAMIVAAPASAAPGERGGGERAQKLAPADRMIDKINQVRAKHDLRPLRAAPRLARSSRGYAGHLIRTNSFGHGSAWTRNGFRRTGEILALRRGWSRNPSPALHQWLDSSGHAALIHDPSFRYIGVGPARGYFGGARTTIWVAHFGAH
jgi:uncharacterized protein YkwD